MRSNGWAGCSAENNEVGLINFDSEFVDITCDEVLENAIMKLRIVALIVASLIAFPHTSHAFGLMRYAFDMVANQFGLDRGPIPQGHSE